MTDYVSGLSGEEIVTSVAEILNMNIASTADRDKILRWVNRIQLLMFRIGDWPELIVCDASFTTDAPATHTYNLVTEIGTQFGRVKDKSVRIGTDHIYPMSKGMLDEIDSAGTNAGSVSHYIAVNRKDFRLWPYGSTGETVYLDYIQLPVKITYTTTAAAISFYPENHELIVEGAIYLGMKNYGTPDWMAQKKYFYDELKKYYNTSKPVRYGSRPLMSTYLGF